MQFKNFDSWKAKMKKVAKEKAMNTQDVQQRYILEEFATKISNSVYKDLLVFKGGMVVANILGYDTRTTRDIDTTCSSTIYNKSEVENIFTEITQVKDGSFFEYEIDSITEAQKDDGYSGYVIMIKAERDKACFDLKVDLSNNTLIYPPAIEYKLKSMFDESTEIPVISYHIENIIAEKYETTLDRGEFNTRMRDLFDIAMIFESDRHLIDKELLSKSIIEVSKDRNTYDNLEKFSEIIEELNSSPAFNREFEKYKKKHYPNINLTLEDVFKTFMKIQKDVENNLGKEKKTSLNAEIAKYKELNDDNKSFEHKTQSTKRER